MGGKAPFQVRWRPQFRQAFEHCVHSVHVGTGSENASELARTILQEWVLCEYGLDESIQHGLLGRESTSLPYPHYLYNAIEKYERASGRLERSGDPGPSTSSVAEEVDRQRKAAEKFSGSSAVEPKKKAASRA